MVYGSSSVLFLPLLLEDGFESFFVWTVIRAMVIVFLMENAIAFYFLMVASASAATSASAAASPTSAASPLIRVWWTRRVRDPAP
jgi:hypothetical protein